MRPRVTPLLPLALMAFLGLLTLWLQYTVMEGSGGDVKPVGHDPDAVVENFTVQRLDRSGKLEYTLSAPKMMHFADDGSGEVLYPRLFQVADDGGNFIVTANRGLINRQGEEAFLYGNVLLLREATPQRAEFRVRTEFLHVLAEEGVLRTDRSVTISEGNSLLTGVGMVVNKNEQQFTLQSRVKGIFDVPTRK
ncbi:MAG TPA: LPS export ABC transporter periplasmic protein LptC [Burkholderiales bacterium]|nr:LPS export ABC transporter periplasmic protein LptC [Burkholderiales bacterium]